MIKSKQLAQALFELSNEKMENLDAKFFDFIQKRNLQAQLPSILFHLEKINQFDQEKRGIQIETAHAISDITAKQIKTFLKADQLPEVKKIKKELVAGFRAKYNGIIYDASIQTGLKKLEEKIIN
ncbi:MAG: F0F1 ATP synthase subunit delta [bacterium]